MSSLLKPLRFRFTDPDDVAAYGDRWFRYDESHITSLRARQVMALEVEIGVPLVDVMNGIRASSAMGDMAGSWLGLKLEPGYTPPPFQDYNPNTFAIEWEPLPTEELEAGKDESLSGDQPSMEPGGSTDIPPSDQVLVPDELPSAVTSTTDTISLASMPISESHP